MMWVKWKLVSVCLEIVLILAQNGGTVCAKCTTGTEIILGTPDGTLRDMGKAEARFGPFRYIFNLESR